ncbi:GNAT family N-acetyltransferase [Phenylobacterium sp.]|uniref:GNAT family N-acetyltransferase n=1 Tax=Phenylobacterium sp. TaxID=1871053 RepID=UPI002EDA75C0
MRRLARPEDEAAVHRIYAHPAVVPFLTYETLSPEAFAPVFADLLAGGDFWVWEVDGAVVGFYRATRLPGRAGHVVHLGPLAIDPDRHGEGLGQAMIGDALSCLEAEGALRVELTAEADNVRGLAFYRKLGFAIEGVQRMAYKRAADPDFMDEVLMVQFLGELRGR